MKLPYRLGDSFALPLGDGTTADATIVACDHHIVDIHVAGLELRSVSDRALVLHRWRRSPRDAGEGSEHRRCDRPKVVPNHLGPARAERIVATHLGIADLELPPLYVRNRWNPAFPSDSRYVRIAERGRALDPRELAQHYPLLEALDCSGVALTSLDFPPSLRALRLAWIATPVDVRALAALPLRTLALEHLREVRGVESLTHFESLEQLEMLAFWQFELDDVMPLVQLPHLVRAEIDIGGRRKNVELYRRATWAYPWPFIFEALRASPLERSG